MSAPSTLIRNGLVITAADETTADVLVEDEKVVALAATGSTSRRAGPADTDDRRHRQVRRSPAASTRTRTWRCPSAARSPSDTFETGTRAAAWGGTTTIVDFADPVDGQRRCARASTPGTPRPTGNCAIDYAFHMIMADVNEGSLKEMEALVGEGITSFKLFMAYPGVFYSDDGKVLRALQKGAETGGLIMMHAENGIAIDVLVEQALARGQTDPRYHGVVRHALLEAEATHRAIKLAQVAGRADLHRAPVGDRGPGRGRPGPATRATTRSPRPARSTCSCPPTTWPGRASRAPSTSARRRCGRPSTRRRCGGGCAPTTCRWCPPTTARSASRAQKELGLGDFSKIPNGLPGVETRMDLLHQGVVDGHISPAALDRDRLRHPGADVRALPAQGHDRARLGRRHRGLRPERDAGAVGGRRTT